MVNRRTGLICNFYTNNDELEKRIKDGFMRIAEEHKRVHGNEVIGLPYVVLEGARLFKKRFGYGKTSEEALELIVETGLAKDKTEAKDILNYMVENDIPYYKRFFLLDDGWSRFTLVPDEEKMNYEMSNYSPVIGDFFNAWRAAASINDEL